MAFSLLTRVIYVKYFVVMAKCKYCQQNISRLDKEVCPICGAKHPLDGEDTTTQDITKVLGEYIDPKTVHVHSRILACILAIVFGFLGIHNFYLNKIKMGLIGLITSIVLIGGLGTLLFFGTSIGIFGYLIPYFVIESLMIAVGLSYIFRRDVVDGYGEFLK